MTSKKRKKRPQDDKEIRTPVKKRRRKKKQFRQEIENNEKKLFITSYEWVALGETLHQEIAKYHQAHGKTERKVNKVLETMDQVIQNNTNQMKDVTREFEWVTRLSDVELKATYKKERPVPATTKESWVGNLMFGVFLLLLVFILSMGADTKGGGPPRNFGGYAPMTILTGSMASVYPPNSLVIAKVTNPKELTIGDDITYMKENNSTVTHRIVGIDENYLGTNKRGFETKGTENPRKDEEIVRAENVIGKIVFSSMTLGKCIQFVRENMVLTAISLLLIIWLSDALIKYIKLRKEEKKNDTIN